MIIDIILLSIAFVALVIGTITDIKTREVPDWVNFSLIFAGLGLRLIYSAAMSDWRYLLHGIAGFGAFVALGYLMFYTGQWGGGDSKMMMGLGALMGLKFELNPVPLLLVFLFNVLLVGAVYGIVYSLVLAAKNWKKFVRNFKDTLGSRQMVRLRKMKFAILIVLAAIVILLLKKINIDFLSICVLAALAMFAYLSIYLIIFIKAVENAAMFKLIPPEKLTEGDWIAKDVVVDGKKIVGPKDLGIDREQIKQLIALKKKGKVKKVKVKYGIPFVPSFLAAFVLSLLFGAWWLAMF